MKEAGIDRYAIYLSNAVKHFKREPRGKLAFTRDRRPLLLRVANQPEAQDQYRHFVDDPRTAGVDAGLVRG